MNEPTYTLEAKEKLMLFEFVSEGPKGYINKQIEFTETALKGIYNLAFGDKNVDTGNLNDKIVTNNKDVKKS